MTPADLNVLAEMRARTERLVPGPWTWSVGTIEAHDYDGNLVVLFERESNHVTTRNECAFIAHARTDMPKLLAAVEAVVEIHSPWINPHNPEMTEPVCSVCMVDDAGLDAPALYPCPTIRAVTDAIGGGE